MSRGNRQYGNYDSRANRIAGGILIIIISVIATLSLLNIMGGVGRMISGFLIGVFGYASYAYAFCGIFVGAMVTIGKRITLPFNKAFKYLTLLGIAMMCLHIWFSKDAFLLAKSASGKYLYGDYLKALYKGESVCGLLGGLFAWIAMRICTPAYALVVMIIAFALASILSFYPMLVNKSNYRTKSTKIRAKKKGEAPSLTDIAEEAQNVKPIERQVGNQLFVGTLNEDTPKKNKKQKRDNFTLLFPNQDTASVNIENETAPVDSIDNERRLAKEKLYGKKSDGTIENADGVIFGQGDKEEDITPSLKDAGGILFNRNNKPQDTDDMPRRPQTLKEAFDLPETDEDKAKEFQAKYGYILNTPTTSNDVRGVASKNIAEPVRPKTEPVEPVQDEKKKDEGEDMPYFIREILYGKKDKEEEKPAEPTNKYEEVVEPSFKPLDKPEVTRSIDKNELKPIEKPVETEKNNAKSDDTGSIFTLFGASLPDKKNSGTVKPVNNVKEKPVVSEPTVFEKKEEKPDVYVRPATKSELEKKEDKVLPSLNGDGYNSGYTPTNTPAERPKTRLEEMQEESDAVMPSDNEIRDVFAKPVVEKRERVERAQPVEKKDNSYTNNFNIGKGAKPVSIVPEKKKPEQISIDQAIIAEQQKKPYMAPPTSLLEEMDTTIIQEDFTEKIEILERVFADFKIDAKVIGVTQGPTFSRFELQMPPGISVSSVTKYADDIAMALELKGGVRFETPIPGKNAFGVEVANNVKTTVGLRSIIEGEKFNTSKSVMTFALGKDIANDDIVCDLDSMPHLLIAGGTGSGKSVCINALILSLLYRNGPNDLKLILIDPKMVEMTPYNGLPHLLVPEAIDDVGAAVNSLDWAINEMNKRYKLFKEKARNITEYNEYAVKNGLNTLPRIVIIFDELADFMSKQKKNIEDKINALARLARAAGIHLIISTQRPSVDVITGTIKSNLPSRIALSLKTSADSTTILGCGGAEKLLGYGDMLYYPTAFNSPYRLQGCFVKSSEVFAVVKYIKEHNDSYYDPDTQNAIFKVQEEEKDEEKEVNPSVAYAHAAVGRDGESQQFIDALYMCVKEQKASISRIQRKFNVGYGTAANIVELMEEKGYVSPNKGGNTQRDVLITLEQYYQIYGKREETTEFDLPEDIE